MEGRKNATEQSIIQLLNKRWEDNFKTLKEAYLQFLLNDSCKIHQYHRKFQLLALISF